MAKKEDKSDAESAAAADAPAVTKDAEPEEAAATNGDDALVEKPVNGEEEKKEEKKEEAKETEEKKATAKKPAKKVIPQWASISDQARKNAPKSMLPKPSVQDAILAAISDNADSKGCASAVAISKTVLAENPDLPRFMLKKNMTKLIEAKKVKQVKGTGFSGSFKVETAKSAPKAGKLKTTKSGKTVPTDKTPLENLFPNVFTWATNPKEASVASIKKYIAKNYPELSVDGKEFQKAIQGGETKG